jgi:hypothetical protein
VLSGNCEIVPHKAVVKACGIHKIHLKIENKLSFCPGRNNNFFTKSPLPVIKI